MLTLTREFPDERRFQAAVAAMQSTIAALEFPWNGEVSDESNDGAEEIIRSTIPVVTKLAVEYADALLAELDK
jgi:hypothetical protein